MGYGVSVRYCVRVGDGGRVGHGVAGRDIFDCADVGCCRDVGCNIHVCHRVGMVNIVGVRHAVRLRHRVRCVDASRMVYRCRAPNGISDKHLLSVNLVCGLPPRHTVSVDDDLFVLS